MWSDRAEMSSDRAKHADTPAGTGAPLVTISHAPSNCFAKVDRSRLIRALPRTPRIIHAVRNNFLDSPNLVRACAPLMREER
jgi:hypothetical protein